MLQVEAQIKEALKDWDPKKDPNTTVRLLPLHHPVYEILSGTLLRFSGQPPQLLFFQNRNCRTEGMLLQGDPFKTLFVARVSYEATERKLKREFEEFGPVKSIRLVHEKNNGEYLCNASLILRMHKLEWAYR